MRPTPSCAGKDDHAYPTKVLPEGDLFCKSFALDIMKLTSWAKSAAQSAIATDKQIDRPVAGQTAWFAQILNSLGYHSVPFLNCCFQLIVVCIHIYMDLIGRLISNRET
jgi:hypothetical protein